MYKNSKLLIIEDDVNFACALKNKIEDFGYVKPAMVSTSDNIASVIKKIEPDLILVSAVKRNKFKTILSADSLKNNQYIPVVYLISPEQITLVEKHITDSNFGYLEKPFQDIELSQIIHTALHYSQTEKKIRHTSSLLNAIRRINQLITREKNKDRLIIACCQDLVKIRGYDYACIVLLNKNKELLTCALSGMGRDKLKVVEMIKQQDLPVCYRKAIKKKKVFLIQKPSFECGNCFLKRKYRGSLGMSIRLQYDNDIYGVLKITTNKRIIIEEEEKELLKELADDIAFALYNIALEQEQKLSAQRLRESEEKYRHLLETLNTGIWVIDKHGYTVYANPHMRAILGYDTDEMVGKHLFSFMEKAQIEKCKQLIVRRKQGIQEQHSFKFLKKDGTVVYTKLTASPITNKNGEYDGAIAGVEDVTEQYYLEKEMLALSRKEQERIGQTLHDSLGQQLTGIALKSKVLEERLHELNLPEATDAKKIKELTNQAIEHTRILSKGLLDFKLEPEAFIPALKEMCYNTEKLFNIKCLLQYKQNILIKDSTTAFQLYKITQEAVNNAVKHAKPTLINISLKRAKQGIILQIVDNGKSKLADLYQNKGLGLRIIRYRADIINASLDFSQHGKQGIMLTCKLSE